ERLVRVEALDLQKPPVRPAIALEELERGGEAARAGKVGLVLHELAIDRMLQAGPAARRRVPGGLEIVVLLRIDLLEALDRRLDHRLPRVVLLAADEFERAIARVVGRPAV